MNDRIEKTCFFIQHFIFGVLKKKGNCRALFILLEALVYLVGRWRWTPHVINEWEHVIKFLEAVIIVNAVRFYVHIDT